MKNIIKVLLLLGGTTAVAQTAVIPNNTVAIGKTGATDKVIELNLSKAGASTNPKIKWDNTAGKLQFSNDGTNYKAFGSGSGSGGGGINLCTENCDFEAGLTPGFTDPDSKATSNSTAPLFDTKDVVFDPSASGQYFRSQAYTVPAGLYGAPCLGIIRYTSTELSNQNQLQILDGSNTLIAGAGNSLPSTGGVPQWGYVPFICPSSGSVKMQVISTGNASAMEFDNWYFGSDSRLADLSQATFVGSVKIVCSGNYSSATTPGPEDVVASGCVYTKQGDLEDPTTSDLLGIRLRNAPAGVYLVTSTFTQAANSSASGRIHIYADASHESDAVYFNSGSSDHVPASIIGSFVYNSPITDVTFKLRTYIDGGTFNISAGGVTGFNIYRFPLKTDQGIRVDQLGWHVDVTLGGTDNGHLGTGTVGSSSPIENSNFQLVNNSGYGVIPAQIPCAGTNPPTGTTCSSSDESMGISFVVPQAGDALVCATFNHYFAEGANTNASASMSLAETPNSAQTIISGQKTFLAHHHDNETAATIEQNIPFRLCETFSFSSPGQKTIRMQYTQSKASGTLFDSFINVGSHWEVYPLNYLSGAQPVFKGMVTTSYSGRSRLEWAKTAPACTSDPCTVTTQSGNFVSAWNRTSTGVYQINFTKPFSDIPVCSCAIDAAPGTCALTEDGATDHVRVFTESSGSLYDSNLIDVICVGKE